MMTENRNIPPEDLARINQLALEPLSPESVLVRSMYLCSDALCEADWGRFSRLALDQIARLLPGESLLCGHNKQALPIGRFYRAEVVDRSLPSGSSRHWVRGWFYWLRGTQGADDLARNIDGGIYREVSISWRFRHAVCSICQENIRACPHTPGRIYHSRRCTYTIDQIEDVLEGSIVYRAADRAATFSPERASHAESAPHDARIPALCHALRPVAGALARAFVPDTPAWLSQALARFGVPDREAASSGSHGLMIVDLSGVLAPELGREIRCLAASLGPGGVLVAAYGPRGHSADSMGDGALAAALVEGGLTVEAEYSRVLPDRTWQLVRGRKDS